MTATCTIAGRTVLSHLAEGASIEAVGSDMAWIRPAPAAPASRHLRPLGRIPVDRRWLACWRKETFWMLPAAGRGGAAVPVGTLMLLCDLGEQGYALLVPLSDGPTSRHAAHLNGYPTGEIQLVGDSGDHGVLDAAGTCVLAAVGDDPYELCARAARLVADRLGRVRLRRDKPLPGFVDWFGWCTWDAFYFEVSHAKVREGLEALAKDGIKPGLLILDDGWQTNAKAPAGHGADRMVSFAANDKFPGGLRTTVRMAKDEFGVQSFLVWHAVMGYWGGIDAGRLPGYGVREVARRYGDDTRVHWPGASTPENWWGPVAAVPSTERMHAFYHDFHRAIAAEGVDGVKIDNQASVEGLMAGQGGRVAGMEAIREAMEGSVQTHFQGNLINCMSCAPEMIYRTAASTITRTSTDFWPKKPETHGLHLWTNAAVCIWFGEFVHGDWDMFHSRHPAAQMHAAGRAVSGSPIYVSDKPGEHDAALIRKLVMAGSRAARCIEPGRQGRRHLFADITAGEAPLCIWNRTAAGGVVGVFHGRYVEASPNPALSTRVGASDVPGLTGPVACWRHHAATLARLAPGEETAVEVQPASAEVVTLAPIVDGLAVIGIERLFCPGAGVAEVRRQPGAVVVRMQDDGDCILWCDHAPRSVSVDGIAVQPRISGNAMRVAVTAGCEVRVVG